jgi:hypothetical protein
VAWSGASASPNGNAAFYPSTATSLTFNNVSGQGLAVATGIKLYKAASNTALTVTQGALTGTSANFTVNAATASVMAFINCTQPTSANTTCTGSPLSTGNNGTLQANVALKDAYGIVSVAASAVSISLTSSSTTNYTVSPATVSIGSGGSQSNQLTVTPAKNNPATTTITAHVTSGGSWPDATIQVTK